MLATFCRDINPRDKTNKMGSGECGSRMKTKQNEIDTKFKQME